MKDVQLGHLVLFLAKHKDHGFNQLRDLQPEEKVGQVVVPPHELWAAPDVAALPKDVYGVVRNVQDLREKSN